MGSAGQPSKFNIMLTDFTENKILDAIFGRRTWSGKPTTLFLSAMTSIPSDTRGHGGCRQWAFTPERAVQFQQLDI